MRKTPLLLLLVCFPLAAQTPYLVKDINTIYSNSTKGSSPAEFAAFGNKVFFAATTEATGTELWSTDGTSAGTSMVADIIPGTGSSTPASLTNINGVLLFSARDVNHGVELWTSDGTAAGTRLFLDLNPGPSSSSPFPRVIYKNRLLFTADDGTSGRELWTTDGTAAGTHMVKDISAGSASSLPASFVTMGDSVYFLAGGGLWKTDGTDAGTVKVATVSALNLRVAGSQLFFEGFTTASSWELWVSDGTESGTHMVTEIAPGSKAAFDNSISVDLTPFGNSVLFVANDGTHGREMWISDGTAAGTKMVRDFVPGAKGMWDDYFANIVAFGGKAFFLGIDSDHGNELWVTDGTEAGTSLFIDFVPGPGSSYPTKLVVSGGTLFFAAGNSTPSGPALYVTDGTVAGTHRLGGETGPGLGFNLVSIWPAGGKVYFAGATGLTNTEPWVTDGTDAGTHMIANLAADQAPSSIPNMLTAAGNLLFFNAVEGTISPATNTAEYSLWRTDGTAEGTFKLRETGQHPGTLAPAGPFVFFSEQPTNTVQLLMSDGSIAGTKPADDFMRRFGKATVGTFFPFGDVLLAKVVDPTVFASSVLWKTTAALGDTAIQLGAPNPETPVEVAGRYAFFSGMPRSPYHYGLWTTDGTPAGTYAVVPDLGDTSSQSPGRLVNAAGTLFFLKTVSGENAKLWKSDGTFDGTVVVKELPTNGGSQLVAAGRNVFFISGGSLWTSDGTDSGTIAFANVSISPGTTDALRAVGNRVVFAQYDSSTFLSALWGSDGTKEGTRALRPPQSAFLNLTNIDGTMYFAGQDDEHGAELWTTDGTVDGTKLLFDVNPGAASSYPASFTKAGNLLYFTAFNDATGYELWALPLTTPSLSISDARASEGDGASVAHVKVTLAPAATQSVTVDYATSDGTARAGEDYDPKSGAITFAPGETSKTIDVTVRGDVLPENNETFFITLRNASGARITKAEGVAIIDDDDQSADIALTSQFAEDSSSLGNRVTVRNNGPRAATDIAIAFTATPTNGHNNSGCNGDCPIAQLAVGASVPTFTFLELPDHQVVMSATATPRQRDPQTANNNLIWTFNSRRTLAMNGGFLTAGTSATITAKFFTQAQSVSSSDPAVVSLSAVTKVTSGMGTFTATALKPGTASVNIDGQQSPLLITVLAPGAQPRWAGGLTIVSRFTAMGLDTPQIITITPSGMAPVSGARATGTVTVTSGGNELARATVAGTSAIDLPVYFSSLGQAPYVINYSGDANFLPDTISTSIFVTKGQVVMTGGLERVPSAPGSFALTVRTTGSPLVAPTGMLSVLNGGVEVAKVALVPSTGGISVAHATIANLPASPTLTINYPGDALYLPGSQQVRVVETRRRSAGGR